MTVKNGEYNLTKPPDDYPGTVYDHGYAPETHVVWWENTGEVVGEDEVIHHINGDKQDNRFENLEKLSRSEHSSGHARPRTMMVLECPACGVIFSRWKRHTHLSKKHDATYCSRSCAGRARHHDFDTSGNVVGKYKSCPVA